MQQTEYAEHVVKQYEEEYGVTLRLHDTPMPSTARVDPRDCDTDPDAIVANAGNAQRMRSVLGLCQFLHTRADISFSLVELSRVAANPTEQHILWLEHLLGYLKRTKHLGLTFGGKRFLDSKLKHQITAFSDATWGSCLATRKSMTCFTVMLNGATIFHKSKRQKIVATSTAQSEYCALSSCVSFVRALLYVMHDLGFHQVAAAPVTTSVDNQAAIAIGNDVMSSVRSRCFEIKHHFVKHAVHMQWVKLKFVESNQNPSDVGTKPLERYAFVRHVRFILGGKLNDRLEYV